MAQLGTLPKRRLWRMKRGIRSGSDLAKVSLRYWALVTTGSARDNNKQADNCRKESINWISRCGAIGSALALGARHRPQGIPKLKTPKSLVNTDFFGTILSHKNFILSGLTTDLTTYRNWPKIEQKSTSGCGAVGSARRLGRRCRRFESCHSDHIECL